MPLLPESPRFLLLDRGDRQACEKGVCVWHILQIILLKFALMVCGVSVWSHSPSFKEAMGQQGPQHGGGGDARGESCLAERSQPLGDGADSEPNSPLAAPHHPRHLHRTAALWHQRCE